MKIPAKLPVISVPDTPLISTTQEEIPIAEITENIVLMKDGGAALILETTSLNFGLLSEKEQEAVIYAYAALLNSLSFSIQILVRSQRKDISNYITYLDNAMQNISNPKLQILMQSYKGFIAETIKKRNVLGKRFFIVIPFSPYELGTSKSFNTFTNRSKTLPFTRSYAIKKALIVLLPKRDHLIRQSGRLGLKLRQLTNEDLIELYHDVFNPRAPLVTKTEGVNQSKQQ